MASVKDLVHKIIFYVLLIFLMLLSTNPGLISSAEQMPSSSVQNNFGKLNTHAPISCSFDPAEVKQLYEASSVPVYANCMAFGVDRLWEVPETLRLVPDDPDIAESPFDELNGVTNVLYDEFNRTTSWNQTFLIRGLFLGRTVFKLSMSDDRNLSNSGSVLRISDGRNLSKDEDHFEDTTVNVYNVSVIRRERMIDHLFLLIVILLVSGGNIGMGCKVDLAVVKEVLTKPIAPIIGFCCQYLIMPLTAFSLIRLLGLTGGQALGFFAAGCAPGGSSSNMYSYLLGGDVSLSVTLTLISLLASLGMIPLYLFTIGRLIIEGNTRIKIPFQNILYSLLSVLIPIAVGLIIQKKLPKVARVLIRCLRPFYIVLILCLFSIGVYSNLYIFRLIRLSTVLAGCALPYAGFALAATAAAICRQPRARILTIAIETGLQNTGIPIILMKLSLPQPEADLSIVAPVVVAMFMPLPLWIAVTIVEIRRRCFSKKVRGEVAENGEMVNGAKVDGETKSIEPFIVGGVQNGFGAHDGGEAVVVNGKSQDERVVLQTVL